MNFKEIFRDLKEEKSVSLTEISKNTGIPVTTLSNYINRGSIPRSDQLSALSDYFGVSVDCLIGNEELAESKRTGGEINLSPEEIKFIQDYRKLGPFQQETLRIQIEALAEKKEPTRS